MEKTGIRFPKRALIPLLATIILMVLIILFGILPKHNTAKGLMQSIIRTKQEIGAQNSTVAQLKSKITQFKNRFQSDKRHFENLTDTHNDLQRYMAENAIFPLPDPAPYPGKLTLIPEEITKIAQLAGIDNPIVKINRQKQGKRSDRQALIATMSGTGQLSGLQDFLLVMLAKPWIKYIPIVQIQNYADTRLFQLRLIVETRDRTSIAPLKNGD